MILAVLAVLVAVAVWLCSRGTIRPNHVVGIRTATFLASDAAWRTGHRAAILPTLIAAVACVVVTVIAALDPALAEGNVALLINTTLVLLGVIVGAVVGTRAIKR